MLLLFLLQFFTNTETSLLLIVSNFGDSEKSFTKK